jgi:hypothetical protein
VLQLSSLALPHPPVKKIAYTYIAYLMYNIIMCMQYENYTIAKIVHIINATFWTFVRHKNNTKHNSYAIILCMEYVYLPIPLLNQLLLYWIEEDTAVTLSAERKYQLLKV